MRTCGSSASRRTWSPGYGWGTLAAPIWGLFAGAAYRNLAVPAPWQPPPGLVAVRVRRRDGGYAPSDSSDATYTEYFVEGSEPTARGIAQRVMRRLRLWSPLR